MRDRFVQTLCDLARRDPRIVLITADLGFGVLDAFAKQFPNQFMNVGVAEQNMALVATGLALEGHVVFTYSIGNFPTLRCLEMIRNDVAYHKANVKVVSIGGGFSYGALGMSHHATEDLAIMRAIPETIVFSPTSDWEVEEATKALVRVDGAGFLRLDKDKAADGPLDETFEIGRPRRLRKGHQIAVFATGGILSQVNAAIPILEKNGIAPSVFSVHTISPLRAEEFVQVSMTHPILVTVEEHNLNGGLGSAILELLADQGALPKRFLRLGLSSFSSIVGSQQYLRRVFGLDASAISARIREFAES